MKLTTLNLQGFMSWEERKPNILAYLQEANPDVVLFQEVVFLPEISPHNQVQLLNRDLGYPFEHSAITRLQVGVEYETYREGLSLLSKFPIVKTDVIILKKEPLDEHNRIILLADLLIDGRVVEIANVHFSLTDVADFATRHLGETLDILAERGERRIIAGDFNLENLEQTAELWQEHYSASTRVSYISQPNLNKRIDYILIPKSYHFDDISVSDEGLSDHCAVTATVNVAIDRVSPRIDTAYQIK